MRKNGYDPKVFLALALLGLAMLAAPGALAAVTFTVNSTLDQPDDLTLPGTCHTAANTCTLRAAVMQANRSSGAGATIMVPSGIYYLTIPRAGGNREESGDLDLTTPASGDPVITIIGAGASTTIIDANQLDRVFHVQPLRTATISGVTIRNGYTDGSGGGINNEGLLTVSASTISGNHSDIQGGGISGNGKITVLNSTISQNTTGRALDASLGYGYGGGIESVGNLTVINSTISQNNASHDGGGIYQGGGGANIYNTSIVFNVADSDLGGVGSGGGVIIHPSATFNLRNTLIAGNNSGSKTPLPPFTYDCTGTVNVYGRNIIGTTNGCTINVVGIGSFTALAPPLNLGPLQDNGGPTLTHALLPGNFGIDWGDPVQGCIGPDSLPLPTDQRGAPRVAGARCDIGAFEYSLPPPTALAIEYHHTVFDHYFVTAIADEITKLDNGTFAGWARTGQSFKVYPNTAALLAGVCRFFSTAFGLKSSHFYTPDASECADVQANPKWLFEAVVFSMARADGNGNCPAGTQPIYRLYNNGQGAAPNHRYTTSLAIRTQMLAQGWIPEGYGSIGVIMCTPV